MKPILKAVMMTCASISLFSSPAQANQYVGNTGSYVMAAQGNSYVVRGQQLFTLQSGSEIRFGDRMITLGGAPTTIRLSGHCDVPIPANVAVNLAPQLCAPNFQYAPVSQADYLLLKNLGQYQGIVAPGTPGSIPVTAPGVAPGVGAAGLSGAGMAFGAAAVIAAIVGLAGDDDTSP